MLYWWYLNQEHNVIILGTCKPRIESWIPPISNLNPESKPFWNMNPRKLKFESRIWPISDPFWNLNPESYPIWYLNTENPWSVWNLTPESLDPPLQGPNIDRFHKKCWCWLFEYESVPWTILIYLFLRPPRGVCQIAPVTQGLYDGSHQLEQTLPASWICVIIT